MTDAWRVEADVSSVGMLLHVSQTNKRPFTVACLLACMVFVTHTDPCANSAVRMFVL